MTWFAFPLGVVLGVLGTCIWLLINDDEDVLDSEEEYVDNTPTF